MGEALPLTYMLGIVCGIMLKGSTLADIAPQLWSILIFLALLPDTGLEQVRGFFAPLPRYRGGEGLETYPHFASIASIGSGGSAVTVTLPRSPPSGIVTERACRWRGTRGEGSRP
jgi:hypothetical protein